MPKLVSTLAALALLLTALPIGAAAQTPDCPSPDGRELLTVDGWEATTNGALPSYDQRDVVREATDHALVSTRNGWFAFQTAFGDAASANVTFTLTWDDPVSDYDLWVLEEDDGLWELGKAEDINPETEQAREELSVTLTDCMRIQVYVRNYAGDPTEELTLSITVEPHGDAGDPVTDERTFLYLASDRPGQLSMAHGQPNNVEQIPSRASFADDRPTGNQPNSYTRALVGFNDYRNLLQAHFNLDEQEDLDVVGDASALVWVSSATMADHDGTLSVRLYLDGSLVGDVEVPGAEIGTTPTPLFVSFPDINMIDGWDLTLQVSAEPVAASDGTTSPSGNAQFTVWYDSVQYPSVLILP